ncbi:MAG: hypothetical protein ACREIP_08175 [Alphaproteobacteria bacterium]
MIGKSLADAAFVAALVLAAGHIAAVRASPLAAGELQARTGGGEFRGYGSTRRSPLEDVIWRFRTDGTVMSVSQIRRKYGFSSQFEEYSDAGRWRIEGDRLCVEFDGSHRDFSGCYAVDGSAGDQVRLAGPVHLQGTLGH